MSKAGKRLQEEAEHKFAEEGTDVRVMRESAARAARGEEDGDDSKEQGGFLLHFDSDFYFGGL